MKITKESLNLTQKISDEIKNQTFHHHYHILFDIANSFQTNKELNYVEIGCYAGGSACLLLQRPKTNVTSIDLGNPIDKSVVINNVNKLNKLSNKFVYLKGNSQTEEMVNKLKSVTPNIDILFIDGDHSYKGVINDFNLYHNLVNPGGYIVFDDYLDFKHSPNVKPAVDFLVKSLNGKYEIIGTLDNVFGARPTSLKKNNTFILKKI
jgi:cephalosporin hydroxylase